MIETMDPVRMVEIKQPPAQSTTRETFEKILDVGWHETATAARLFILTLIWAGLSWAAPSHAAPRVVETRTAAPSVMVVVLQTDPTFENEATTPTLDPLNLALGEWKINGQSPVRINRYSLPWDEDRQRLWDDPEHPLGLPVTTRHRIYLHLPEPLAEGRVYRISTPYGEAALDFGSRRSFCESIKVNQVGYNKRATSRFANFGVYMGDGGSMRFDSPLAYEVVRESDGQVVANGNAIYLGDNTALEGIESGEHVYRLRLGTVPEGGPYFVSIPGCGRSRSFGVGDTFTRQIAYVSTRGMYHHRCGMALEQPFTAFTHAACHTKIALGLRSPEAQDNVVVPPDAPLGFIQGGYHDAGDMDHVDTHAIISILMLSAFEAFPSHFIDNQYNIPESGNGIPDFLDEAMWGVLLWERLQLTNGSGPETGGVMAGWSTKGYTLYGYQNAANDQNLYGTMQVQKEITARCAGIFAHASRLIRPYDAARADALLDRARLAWKYVSLHGDIHAPESNLMYAALQLYLATGEASFHSVFQAAARRIVAVEGAWPEQYLPGNTVARCQTAFFISYLLPGERVVNHDLVTVMKNKVLRFAEEGSYMGPAPEDYPYPQGVTKFLGWGSGTAQGRYADVWIYASLLTTDSSAKQRYVNAVSQYADYSLGLNPMGMSYYTGLGVDQPTTPLDCNSYYTKHGLSDGVTPDTHRDAAGNPIGNVPGTLVYGPAGGRSGQFYELAVSNKMFPAYEDQPEQRRYANGWSLIFGNEFTTHETMVWNVVMNGFLYDAGSDASRPITMVSKIGEGHRIVLKWDSVPGQKYQVESSSTLKPDGWIAASEPIEAAVPTLNWSQPASDFQAWFRVKRLTSAPRL